MSNNQEIKSCPFCGGGAKYDAQTLCIGHGEYLTKYYVKCVVCGASGGVVTDRDRVKDVKMFAIGKWNCRTTN